SSCVNKTTGPHRGTESGVILKARKFYSFLRELQSTVANSAVKGRRRCSQFGAGVRAVTGAYTQYVRMTSTSRCQNGKQARPISDQGSLGASSPSCFSSSSPFRPSSFSSSCAACRRTVSEDG